MAPRIVLLPGDGIGPEILPAAVQILDAVGSFDYEEHPFGGAAIDATGEPLPAETLKLCRESDAVLLGAVGGPKWDDPAARVRPEQGLLGLRQALGLFANLRPVRALEALAAASPLRPEITAGVDLLVVRELTGGLYFGKPRRRWVTSRGRRAVDTLPYREEEITRVVRLACELATARRACDLRAAARRRRVVDARRRAARQRVDGPASNGCCADAGGAGWPCGAGCGSG